ncbi:MAG TPA: O-antigen ligase family protein [Pyrinomonadaceae bacterium]|nr:O-antigen ligase family protein [Pyrinomonadaceae bacterium]
MNPDSTSTLARSLERALTWSLFAFAFCAPHSIAATQAAWILAMLLWSARLFVRPRPALRRTPVDYALLGFFILTFISALCSYEPFISIGKLRAASLFTIVYVTAQNVRSRRLMRALVLTLVASCLINVVYTLGLYARGRGVKVVSMTADSPLRASGVREGDRLLEVEGRRIGSPDELASALDRAEEAARAGRVGRAEGGAGQPQPDASGQPQSAVAGQPTPTVQPTSRAARLRAYRLETYPVFELRHGSLRAGATAGERLGLTRWTRGRDERASGFYGHYVTYAEVLQLVASLALGLFLATRRKWSLRGAFFACSFAGLACALLLTVTRASWLGLLLSALTAVLVGASRRTLFVACAVALPLVVTAALVLQQKRQVGFLDPREGSTAWRLMVYRESLDLLVREPRHLLVGVGMDSLKKRYREFELFDKGRQNIGHLHSTPLQIAVERGLPALLAWLALVLLYARTLWRLTRRKAASADATERGFVLGALGGLVGFMASGAVHYNLGDSEVVMVFYFVMGLALALDALVREEDAQADAT